MQKVKNIIITGGLGSIGSSILLKLLKNGHNVICSDLKSLDKKKNKFYKIFPNFFFYKVDITKKKNIIKLVNFAKTKFKSIDIVIHCAYPKMYDWTKPKHFLNEKYITKIISNHLAGSIILSKIFIENSMKYNNPFKLILFSSIYGISIPRFEDYPKNKIYSPVEYAVIKSGIITLTKYLAKFHKKNNILINCISPGGIKSPNLKKSFINNYRKHCNSKGFLDPNDLHGLVEYLISDESNMMNGQNIIIDDGWSL